MPLCKLTARVAAAIVLLVGLTACEQSEREAKPHPEKQGIVQKTAPLGSAKEIITLKGVEFDKPNVKDIVQKLCLPEGYSAKKWCKFSELGGSSGLSFLGFPKFVYGNLGSSAGSIASVLVNEDGALVEFTQQGLKAQMLELAELLTEKYGRPVVRDEVVQNRLGAKFEKKTFIWIDARGTQLSVQSIDENVDLGTITIVSASLIKKRIETGRTNKSEGLKNL